jgi:hypothetical protein
MAPIGSTAGGCSRKIARVGRSSARKTEHGIEIIYCQYENRLPIPLKLL